MMRELLLNCLKAHEIQFIVVTNFGVEWTDYKNKFKTTFDQVSLKLAISFLLVAICHFGKSLESQWVLIQPLLLFMASLFLYYFGNKWLLNTKKRDLRRVRLFGNLFCFLDNLWAINDRLKFDKNCKDTYSSGLELKQKTYQPLKLHIKSLYTNIPDSESMAKVKRAFDNYSKNMFSSKVIPSSLALMLTLNKPFRSDVHKVIANSKVCDRNHLFAAFANIFMTEAETKYI